MKAVKLIFIFVLIFFGISQNSLAQLFENGDRVCFVGNSITHGGGFHHNIMQYYVTRFPNKTVTFYNCGISGDVTGGLLKRLDSDVLINKPTHAVIMIGMNDIQRQLYKPYPVLNADTLRQREIALKIYSQNLDSIVRYLLSKNVKVILQKPSIYDETAKIALETKIECNGALKTCAGFIQELANKYNLQTVDYQTLMLDINRTIQLKDSTATIVGQDRVHPGMPGNLIMAYQFLKTTKSPQYVSKMVISKSIEQIKQLSLNCTIRDVKYNRKGVRFRVKENSLPFTFNNSQKPALKLIPFVEDLNQEIIQIEQLKPGSYEVRIDTCFVGTFSDTDLKTGVNLALVPNTPQYQQSLVINKALAKLWENEKKLRDIIHLEFMDLRNFKDQNDFTLSVAFLESVYAKRVPEDKGLKTRLESYKKNKPYQKSLEKQSDELRASIYQLAQTKEHIVDISMNK